VVFGNGNIGGELCEAIRFLDILISGLSAKLQTVSVWESLKLMFEYSLVLPFWCRLTWVVPDKIQEGQCVWCV